MDQIFNHRVPAVLGAQELKTIAEINNPQFDFNAHFLPDVIAQRGRWLACLKVKPWTEQDLMIIDGEGDYYRDISAIGKTDLEQLQELIDVAVTKLDEDESIKFIVAGANINPFVELSDSESIQRMHIHVCGFSRDEIARFSPSAPHESDIYNDPLIEEFKQKFDFSSSEFTPCEHGIKQNLAEYSQETLGSAFKSIKTEVEPIIQEIKRESQYSCISYSFALKIEGSHIQLFISPKSKSGRGVLEVIGLVLLRDGTLKADKDFIKRRDNFLIKLKESFLKIPTAIEGKSKLEEV